MSQTTANEMIRRWRQVRLYREGAKGYPKTNILHPEHGLGTVQNSEIMAQRREMERDADIVQGIVNTLPEHIRAAFEAYELGLIRGHSAKNYKHKARAVMLAITLRTYYRRNNDARVYIAEALQLQDTG